MNKEIKKKNLDEEQLEAKEPFISESRCNPLKVSDSQGRVGVRNVPIPENHTPQEDYKWYVLRDLRRPIAKHYHYEELQELGFKVFLPKMKKVVEKDGKRKKVVEYVFYNLFFIYSDRATLDPEVESREKLQYLFKRGFYHVPLIIPTPEMERFIHAVEGTDTPHYYLPEELLPGMLGKTVHITGGPLAGYEGRLLKAKGRGKRRLIVELSGILCASVEVEPQHIEEINLSMKYKL